MLSLYVFAAAVLFATNASATIALPRGEALFFDEIRLLFARDPQSDSFCDGITCSGDICVPSGYHCCSDGGAGCPVGSNCIPNGCCPIGKTCTGGGGTITDPGTGPTLDFSSTPAGETPPANTQASHTAASFNPGTSSKDSYESFIATAFPSTGTAAGGLGTTTGFPAISVATATALLPSVTPVSGGSSSGASSSGGSSSARPASGAEPISRSTVLSGIAVVAGVIAMQIM